MHTAQHVRVSILAQPVRAGRLRHQPGRLGIRHVSILAQPVRAGRPFQQGSARRSNNSFNPRPAREGRAAAIRKAFDEEAKVSILAQPVRAGRRAHWADRGAYFHSFNPRPAREGRAAADCRAGGASAPGFNPRPAREGRAAVAHALYISH